MFDDATPFVVLRHTLPDGGVHLDFLIRDPNAANAAGADARILRSFRLAAGCDVLDAGGFDGVRIPDHRAVYLEYEGPIGGARGEVVRVVSGVARVSAWNDEAMTLRLECPGRTTRVLKGARIRGDVWRFAAE